jgi:hypothetical protein
MAPRHDSRALLGRHAIKALTNAADGVDLHRRCYCGARCERRRSSSAARSRSSSTRRRTLEMIGSCGPPFPQLRASSNVEAAVLSETKTHRGPPRPAPSSSRPGAGTCAGASSRRRGTPELLGRRTGSVPVNPAEGRRCQVVLSGPPSRRRCSIASGSNAAWDKAWRRPSRDESPCATSSRCHPPLDECRQSSRTTVENDRGPTPKAGMHAMVPPQCRLWRHGFGAVRGRCSGRSPA